MQDEIETEFDDEHEVVEFSETPFYAEIQRFTCCADEECCSSQGVVYLNSFEADLLASLLADAYSFNIENDKTVFEDGNVDGHMSLPTLISQKLSEYFTSLADAISGKTVEERMEEMEADIEADAV